MRFGLLSRGSRATPALVGLALLSVTSTATAVALTSGPAPVAAPTLPPPAVARPLATPTPATAPAPTPMPAPTPAPTAASGLPRAPSAPAPVPAPTAPAPVVPPVSPLAGLVRPDVLVTLPASLTQAQIDAVASLKGVQATTVLDTGTVTVAGAKTRVVGVDPSQFRAFTPQETAGSDPLWQAVARGELVSSYLLARTKNLLLGEPVTVTGAGAVTDRLGAIASLGLPDVDLVVDRAAAASYGATRSGGVLLSAPDRTIDQLRSGLRKALGKGADLTVLRPKVVTITGKPSTYRELYLQAAPACPGLPWQVLAAIGQIESGHGANVGPSSAGAMGPMQFLPSTWAYYGVDGDGDGVKDILDPYDAVPAAAGYLCRNGAGQGGERLYSAIFAYNHLDSYVQQVLALAARIS